jgi:hypothetical protein
VLLIEGFADATAANAAMARVGTSVGGGLTVYRVGGPAVAPPPATTTMTATEWLARAREAHGGASGGAAALARAAVVHVVYDRVLTLDDRTVRVRHEYWRDGANRRLDITPVDSGSRVQASVAIANSSGAWMKVGTQVQTRDQGVVIGTVDDFSPESILTVAFEAWRLLGAAETAEFRVLEGADAGVRVGSGKDEKGLSLSFVDIDPTTGLLLNARYITEAGPLSYMLSDYRTVADGVIAPYKAVIQRSDGRREEIFVEKLEILSASPAGTYDRPEGS